MSSEYQIPAKMPKTIKATRKAHESATIQMRLVSEEITSLRLIQQLDNDSVSESGGGTETSQEISRHTSNVDMSELQMWLDDRNAELALVREHTMELEQHIANLQEQHWHRRIARAFRALMNALLEPCGTMEIGSGLPINIFGIIALIIGMTMAVFAVAQGQWLGSLGLLCVLVVVVQGLNMQLRQNIKTYK